MKSKMIIPKDWKILKGSDCIILDVGSRPKGGAKTEGDIPSLGGEHINRERGTVDFEKSPKFISYDYFKKMNKGRLKKDDIIINKDGAWTGKVAYVKDLFAQEIAINEHLFIIRNNGNFNQKYLFYYLLSTPGQKQIKLSITGAAQPGINTKFINLLSIPKPPLNEQQKIADILSKADEQIDFTEKIIKKTEELKKGLMQKLLIEGIGHDKLIERKIGLKNYKLPAEWGVKTIEETSFLKGRIGWQGLTTKEYLDEGDYILVTGTDFSEGKINWETCVYVEEDRYIMDENIQLKNEDILVTKDGTIGKIAYVRSIPKPATLNSGIFVLRPLNGEYYPKFLYYILKSFYFDYFMNILKAGSTISHLYQRDLVNFKFPVPSLSEQKQIASILSKVDEQIQDNKKELKHLQELKKGLMQDLLTGEVRVSV